MLYAADFHNGKVNMFDKTFTNVTPAGAFTDPAIPAGFNPFGIQAIGSTIYVAYAKLGPDGERDQSGPGNGMVDAFDTAGHLVMRVATNGPLNSPWGIALAPANFGAVSNDLLIGNFGDGTINAFNAKDGRFAGELETSSGQPIAITHLWGLAFGNGGAAGPTNTLYFTAGLTSHLAPSNAPFHGLFGSLQVASASSGDATTVNRSEPVPVNNSSVGISALAPNSSSQPNQGIEALLPISNAMTTAPASDLQAIDQPIDGFAGTSHAMPRRGSLAWR
jgi:hypothetical protein